MSVSGQNICIKKSLFVDKQARKAKRGLVQRCLDGFWMPFIREKKCTAECKMEVLEWKANKKQDDDGCSLGTCCVVFIVILIPDAAYWAYWIQMVR